jgi:hypothetical protein
MALGIELSAECQPVDTRQNSFFAECRKTLDKAVSLPSANFRRSIKLTAVSYRRLLMALCRVPSFAECLALRKDFVAECFFC